MLKTQQNIMNVWVFYKENGCAYINFNNTTLCFQDYN